MNKSMNTLNEYAQTLSMANAVLANGGNLPIRDLAEMANAGVQIVHSLPSGMTSGHIAINQAFIKELNKFKSLIGVE